MASRLRSSRPTYRATSTSSGTDCRQGATFLRQCDGSIFQRRVVGRDRWAFRRWLTASLRRLPDATWSRSWSRCIRGWITYYSHFYKTQLRPPLKRIDAYVIRWVRRKFKRMRHQTKGARDWFDRVRRANPTLFAHWTLCHGNGRTSGAV